MLKKNKQVSLILSVIIVLGFTLLLGLVLRSASLDKNITVSSLQGKESLSLPLRFKIPTLGINAFVEYVGLTTDGAMDVPKGSTEVAWYKFGSLPGEIGSAVIAGHSGWKNNEPAVFDNLNKLKKGDKIYIEDEKGAIITFIVRDKQLYDPGAYAADVFSSNDEKAHLNLVTCEGVWNKVTESHSKRLVVFADEEIK